ncbi:MAG: hypothetical protein WAO55_12115 [Candidatus Manganitrophaceae bacterium]
MLSYSFCSGASAQINEIEGEWTFVEDGTVLDVATCPAQKESLCAAIVKLPSNTKDDLAPGERTLLCRAHLLGDLRSEGVGDSNKAIYRGWIIDPEDLLKGGSPTHYNATLTITSPARALIEVQAAGGLYSERHELVRNVAPVQPCEMR